MSNYPDGAEHDPNAPWNQVEVDITATVVMSIYLTVDKKQSEESIRKQILEEIGMGLHNLDYSIDEIIVE